MTTDKTNLYDDFAALLAYPEPGYHERAEKCLNDSLSTRQLPGRTIESLRSFYQEVRGAPLERLQEVYTQTFDLNPNCALEIGWHLYGENYERGSFLLKMRALMRSLRLAESAELPDHLGHVLMVLGRLDDAQAKALAGEFVIPALLKIHDGVKEQGGLYGHLLKAISEEIERHLIRSGEVRRV